MSTPSRIPNYDIRNDGYGPYAIFYCDACNREFRSKPDVTSTIKTDIGRQAMGGLLRKIPLVGNTVAENVTGEDPRYSYKMSPAQIESGWKQVQQHFRECPTCQRIVCLSDWDAVSEYCNDDTPRADEIAEARGAQAGAALKGIASAFGLGDVMKNAENAARQASAQLARCPNDGMLAEAGTRFCPECGTAMIQPASTACAKCGAETRGAKFCPECGARVEQPKVLTHCPDCGAEVKGAKFCPECGKKLV